MSELVKINTDLWREIDDTGDVLKCYQCGTCVGGCPASEAEPPLRIRKLVRMVVLGLEDKLIEEVTPWICVTCTSCEEKCPRDIRPFEIGIAIRRWQARKDETYIPAPATEVFQTGHTQAVGKVQELRKSVGLEELPPTIVKFPELLAKFQDMLEETEIVKNNKYLFKR